MAWSCMAASWKGWSPGRNASASKSRKASPPSLPLILINERSRQREDAGFRGWNPVAARDGGDAKSRGGETMGLKNLVVVVDQSAQSAARVNAAILLATKHDAHLTGLFVASPPILLSYVAGELGE